MVKNLQPSSIKLELPHCLKWVRGLRKYFIKNEKEQQKKQRQEEEEEVLLAEDFISRLPDDILLLILSKLPIRDAAVSKRWAPLFPTLPSLKIDAASFYPTTNFDHHRVYAKEWINALSSVLQSRKAPINKFEISSEVLDRYNGHFYEVFRGLCVSGVELLSITNCDYVDYRFEEPYRIPSPVFSCNTIVKLEIFNCNLVVPANFTGLKAVKSLVLCNVTVTESDLRRMISGCKEMEKLVFITSRSKPQNIVIHAPNLVELVISVCKPTGISLFKCATIGLCGSIFWG